jgi:hypothetical protein
MTVFGDVFMALMADFWTLVWGLNDIIWRGKDAVTGVE